MEGNRSKYIALISVSVACLILAGVLFYFTVPCVRCGNKICFGNCSSIAAGTVTGVNRDSLGNLIHPTVVEYSGETDPAYMDDIIFIGDSRTVGLQLVGVPTDQIWAETGMFHKDALTKKMVVFGDEAIMTIPEALTATAPKVAIVNFGINGFGYIDDDVFYEQYKEMMEGFIQASPKTAFVIEGILPVSAAYASANGYANADIDAMNRRLTELAEELGCYYLATGSVMKDESNNLLSNYNSGDGLHYTKAGSQAILTYIGTHRIPTWKE